MKLDGAVAIVTGSAAGLGAATAIRLAAAGTKVAINYTKSEAEAKDVFATIEAAGGEAVFAKGDVSDDEACRKIVQTVIDKWGRVDILVNNAGTTQFADHDDLDALQAEDFHRIYAVNVIGAYQMVRACTPYMKEQGAVSIVKLSSIA